MIGIFNIGGIIGAIIYSVIGAVILLLIVPLFKPLHTRNREVNSPVFAALH